MDCEPRYVIAFDSWGINANFMLIYWLAVHLWICLWLRKNLSHVFQEPSTAPVNGLDGSPPGVNGDMKPKKEGSDIKPKKEARSTPNSDSSSHNGSASTNGLHHKQIKEVCQLIVGLLINFVFLCL